jgi:hypothetical protein
MSPVRLGIADGRVEIFADQALREDVQRRNYAHLDDNG